jgi:hypothetical protein
MKGLRNILIEFAANNVSQWRFGDVAGETTINANLGDSQDCPVCVSRNPAPCPVCATIMEICAANEKAATSCTACLKLPNPVQGLHMLPALCRQCCSPAVGPALYRLEKPDSFDFRPALL